MMWRYVRLYAYFVRFAISKHLEFRMNYLFRFLSDLLFLSIHLLFFSVLYSHVDTIGGWTRDQALFLATVMTFIDAFLMATLVNNIWELPGIISKGDLDYYLVRPVSSLFFLTLREFDVSSVANVVINFSVMMYFMMQLDHQFNGWTICMFCVAVTGSIILVYSLNILTVIPTFWTGSPRGMQGIYWSFVRFAEQPDAIYTGWIRRMLVTVVPFALLYSFPARIMFGDQPGIVLLHLWSVALVFFALALWLWGRGMKVYSSASS